MAFGNDPRAMALHDQLLLWLLRQHLAVEVPDFAADSHPGADLSPYVGTYRSNQLRVDVRMVDGQLEETMTYEPLDAVQERIFTKFAGGSFPVPPRRFVPVGETSSRRPGCRYKRSADTPVNYLSHTTASVTAVRPIGAPVVA